MIHRVLALALLALVSCAGTGPSATVEPIEETEALPLQLAYQGLCDARALAEAGDVQSAADMYEDRSHAYVHELADRISSSDRDGAARLLEAKQIVEAQLANPDVANPQAVAGVISGLEAALAGAAEAAGFERPSCGGVPS